MPPQKQDDPYGFITNPEQSAKRKISFHFGNTPGQRLVIVGVGFLLLIIIFVFLLSVFNRASNAQKDRLISMAQTQTEIARVAELAGRETDDANTRSLAINVQLTLESDLQEINDLLAKRGVKLKQKTLDLGKDEATDKALEEAAANNQFDETFNSILKDQLDKYKTLIKSAYDDGGRLEKQTLQQNYDDVALLQ